MNDMPDQEKMQIAEAQKPILEPIEEKGFILDVGGGGEGVIGQLMGKQVISIDKNKRELEEAPSDNLKIVMDATDLQFLDETFGTAVSFYTLMYMDKEVKQKTINEVYRVLKPGGKFLIWDSEIPSEKPNNKVEFYVVPLQITLPKKEIGTSYGVRFLFQDKKLITEMCKKAGFELNVKAEKDSMFYFEFLKK
ncbi:MAG: methyltransferase domain-containing protein [Candidatus Heimdallarchaeota archaeon]|nr:methyltransferase domain-containing protein [Candidatus Heimdallarchaeota archaeon]MBY8993909.1 methyltransferase domain-containing protein [Candidatus Heimdallarchaeota archaeon]